MSERGWAYWLSDERGPTWGRGALVLLFLVAFFATILFPGERIFTNDGFYHIKMAYLLWSDSPSGTMRWLPFTIGKLGVNHNYLFHWLLVPFTFGHLFDGLRLAAIALATLSVFSLYLFLVVRGVRWPFLWVLFFLAIGNRPLFRLLMVRAYAVSVPLFLLLVEMVLRDKLWGVALASFLAIEAYAAGSYALVIVAILLLVRLATERRLSWRIGLAAVAGLALGVLLHPQFPRNVTFVATMLLSKVPVSGVARPLEWLTDSTWGSLAHFWPFWLVALTTLVHALAARRPLAADVWSLGLVALAFFALYLRAHRFQEYLIPFGCAALALYWRDALPALSLSPSRLRLAVLALVAVALLLAGMRHQAVRRSIATNGRGEDVMGGLVRAMRIAEPRRGALVFNVDWGAFSRLFFHESNRRYASGLDPDWLRYGDPQRFALMERILRHDPTLDLARVIRERFGARVIVGPPDAATYLYFKRMKMIELFRSPEGFVMRVPAGLR